MRTTLRQYRTDRREIAYLRFILEAHEGLAVLTTLDASAGHVALLIAPGCESCIDTILDGLSREILLERLPS